MNSVATTKKGARACIIPSHEIFNFFGHGPSANFACDSTATICIRTSMFLFNAFTQTLIPRGNFANQEQTSYGTIRY